MSKVIRDRKITSRISLRGWQGHYITLVDGQPIPGWSTTLFQAILRAHAFMESK